MPPPGLRLSLLVSIAALAAAAAPGSAQQAAAPPESTPPESAAPQSAPADDGDRLPPLLPGFDADSDQPDPEMPAVPPPDPELLAPLPSLLEFDATPSPDFNLNEVKEEGLRYRLQLEGLAETGLEGEFRRLSALQQGAARPATAAQIASRTTADRALLERLLAAEGWYGADVDSTIRPDGAGGMDVRLSALPGERYHWSTITLDLVPDSRPDLADGFGLKPGDAVRAEAVEEAEGALLLKLQENGFPFAAIGVRDVVLSDSEPTASYFLTGDPGEPGVFGPIRMEGFQPFSPRHAAVIARFRPGDPYDVRLVDDLRRALIDTQQFGGVTVAAVDSGEQDSEGRAIAAIDIRGNPGPERLLAGQLGYASREGFRAEASWRHRSLIHPEGTFVARAIAGTEEQSLSTDLSMGNWHQRDRSLLFGAALANLTPPAYHAQTLDLNAGLTRISTMIWQKRWTWSIGASLGLSHEQPRLPQSSDGTPADDISHRTFLFTTLPLVLGYDRSDDFYDPHHGFRLKLEVDPELSRQGGNVETYARMFLGGSIYQPIGSSFVLAALARGGSIVGASLDNLSLVRRLYAGGGGSVRGYRYQGLGLPGTDQSPVGGRASFESSIEGRLRRGDLGFVAFLDGGSVSPGVTPSFRDMRFGAGIGWRYYASFGPLRIDVARAIARRPIDPKIAIYVSIGQAF